MYTYRKENAVGKINVENKNVTYPDLLSCINCN